MNKIYSLLLLCLFATAYKGFAQITVQIGTGTDVSATTLYSPFYRFSAGSSTDRSRSDILLTATEMASAGIPAGATITKIAFNKQNTATITGAGAELRFYMANSSATPPLSTATTWATILTSHTLVYESLSETLPATAGWWDIILTTPFVYSGGGLEIASEWNANAVSGSPTTDKVTWQYTDGLDGQIIGNTGTTSYPATLSGSTTAYKERPNVQITYIPPTPCTAPPTPGTPTATATQICQGSNVILSMTGGTVGTGQTYEWRSSPIINGTYTALGSPASTASLSVTPASTTYYKLFITCSGQTDSTTPILIEVSSPLSGTYTINAAAATSGNNFHSFADFISTLGCAGVSGPVVVNVAPGSGPYNEQLIFTPVAGVSATNTITINGNNNVVSYAGTSAERATIKLNGADHFILKKLNVQATGSSYGYGIQLINDADSNTVDSCTITTNTSSTSTTAYGAFVMSGSASDPNATGSNCDNNTISNNTIVGGYYGVTLMGDGTTSQITGNTVTSNKIQDFHGYGIYANGNTNLLIEGNDISRPVRSAFTTTYAIYAGAGVAGLKVSANRIHDLATANTASTSSMYAIYFTGADGTPGNENIVSNNLVYNMISSGIIYAIYNIGSNYSLYYHNTISLDDQTYNGTSATRGVYQTTAATGLDFKNNIISITRGGAGDRHAIYLNEPTTVATANNNDYYVNAGGTGINYIAYLNSTNYATLADWQLATSQDLNSVTLDPGFQNPAAVDFTPTTSGMNDLGTPVGILTDINGVVRSATNPDLGAFEFSPPPCAAPPAAGDAITSSAIVCNGDGVVLDLINITHGAGQTYVWQSSATLAGTYTDINTATNTSAYGVAVTTPTYYRAEVTCGGFTNYSNPVFVDIRPVLPAGNYTINNALPTSSNNFASFTDAATALRCGTTGSVIIDVAAGSGPYIEQVFFNAIPGTSPSNTITINGNGATISYVSTITNQRDIIRLDGTDYLTINNLNITSSGSSSSEYAIGVHLINDADNNTINSCNILLSTTTTSTNFAGISISAVNTSATGTGDANCDNNVFINNTITGGSYGVALTANGLTFMNQNNQVINNSIKDCYTYAIYVNGGNNTLIQGNDISRPTRSTVSTFYGVALVTGGINNLVSNNRIHDGFAAAPTSTSTAYGLYSSADATVGNPNIFANNIVYNFSSDGDQYGMYNTSAPFNSYYHNTIVFNDVAFAGTDVTRGFYQTTAATDIIVKNNIIYITRGGTGDKHGYYFNTSTSAITTDNNVLYINGAGGVNYIGRDLSGTDHATLAAWQAATSADAASLSADPVFAAPASADFTPTVNTVDNIGAPVGITTDINGAARSITTPDVGAYEFTGFPLAVKLINFNATRQAENVHTSWTTATEADMDKYIVERSVNGREFIEVGIVKSIGNSNATHTYGFTDITAVSHAVNGKLYYRLRMTETSGRTDYSDVAVVNVNNTYLTEVQVYPNPFSGYVMVNTTMQSAAKAVVSIKDIVGKEVYRIEYEMPQGRSSHRIDNLQHLPAGVYEISINVNGEQVVQKLVK